MARTIRAPDAVSGLASRVALPPRLGADWRTWLRLAREHPELLAVAIATPVFWFPFRVPALTVLAMALLPLSLVLAWRLRAHLTARTGLEPPLVYVLVAVCLACLPVTDWQLGLPKVLGMALGATLLIAIPNAVRTRSALRAARLLLALGTLLVAVGGLISSDWVPGKSSTIDQLRELFPLLVRDVVRATPNGGINPNEVAGVLALLLPFQMIQLTARGAEGDTAGQRGEVILGAMALASGLLTLVVTASRSGVVGVALAALLALGLRLRTELGRRRRRPLISLTAGILGMVGLGALAGVQTLRSPDVRAAISESTATRLEIWDRAWHMLRDFPITGIGLGQFDPVIHALYVPFRLPPEQFIPHAHNVLLDYPVELGIPGAAALAVLVWRFCIACRLAMRSNDALVARTGAGLLLGLASFIVYGMTDAIAPGARGGLALWAVLGLGAAVGRSSQWPA